MCAQDPADQGPTLPAAGVPVAAPHPAGWAALQGPSVSEILYDSAYVATWPSEWGLSLLCRSTMFAPGSAAVSSKGRPYAARAWSIAQVALWPARQQPWRLCLACAGPQDSKTIAASLAAAFCGQLQAASEEGKWP